MSVLSVQAAGRRFADRVLFSDVSFRLTRGDRAGLIGPNGTGKSTLLRIVAGLDSPDGGSIALARGTRIGFLQQELLVDIDGTVEAHARGAATHLAELEAELRAMEHELATADQELLERYADAQHQFEHAGGYDFEATLGRVLSGLGLDALRDREVRTLSGGERTRLGLARLLLDDPDLLLLDEPTNHLDIAALEWLETFLVEQDSTLLTSSHDRWFLDRVTARTLSFEPAAQGSKVVEYRGGYSQYARQRADRDASLARAAARQQEEIARTEEYIDRFRAGQRSKQSRGRAKQLARLERIESPLATTKHGWSLEAAHLAGATVLESTPLAVGHGERVVVRTPPLRVERGARIAVVGANGAGKTTLVRTLVGQLPALDGYVSSAPTARVAFLAQAQAELTGDETVMDALREATGLDEQRARDLLARFLFRGDDVFRSVGVLSGGERSRLALARLSAREANLLVLDEPTNHLDLVAREQLERVLEGYEGTIVAVSHDRYFIDKLASEIWDIRDAGLKRYDGGWTAFEKARDEGRPLPDPDTTALSIAGARPAAAPSRPKPRVASRPVAPAELPARSGPPQRRTASRVRKVQGVRALEARIGAMELQLSQLAKKLEDIAMSGDFMETRRLGSEHAALEAALRALYEEWSASAGPAESDP
ncbi:MAG TPA: ABC-F family ATP-binding cassette domain-containing protein [Candidatus Limnocylindria bacterium]|nr:ABC-F family ATP-binding cassette domain-containing protein [Candidatus Limnocylindria bacterium]